jgi:aconitate decarboxylase
VLDRPTRPTAPDGPTGRLATWVSDFTLDQAPQAVGERAKHLILDGLACAIVGAQLPWSRTAVQAVTAFEGAGDVPLIGWGVTTSPPAATLLNGTFIQGFELDDFHPLAPLHSTSLVVPSLLSAARLDIPISGARLLGAAITGFEVGPRVGLSLHGAEMLSRGWHSGSVFGTIASAAAVANLLGLNGAETEDAIGLGATQSAGLMAAQFGAMSKRMHHGLASRNGLYAALLARGGYTGIKGVLEQPYGGFLSTFGEGHHPDPAQIESELGERWETKRIVVKPYAAMGGLHAALDALSEIDATRPLKADDIVQIDVELAHAVYHHGWWSPERPLTPTGAQMNIAYVLAVALIDGVALVDQFSPKRINSDDVWELIPRITAHHNPEFDTRPMGRGQTRVLAKFTDGSTLESYQLAARSVLSPLSNDEIVTKYDNLTRSAIDRERQSRLKRVVLSLDSSPDLEELYDLLAPLVVSPIAES